MAIGTAGRQDKKGSCLGIFDKAAVATTATLVAAAAAAAAAVTAAAAAAAVAVAARKEAEVMASQCPPRRVRRCPQQG